MSFFQVLREHLEVERSEKALQMVEMVKADRYHDAIIQAGYIKALEAIDEWIVDYVKRPNVGA